MISQVPLTLVIVVVAIALLLSDQLRADLVALLVVVTLGLSGILTPQEAFSGFASSAVVTIVSIFVLTEALRLVGITDRAGLLLERVAGTGERGLVIAIMIAGAALSLLMNNIAAAAILLPAVSGLARRRGVNPGHLLMPLAFATILGGTATLFTTTNIVVSGILRAQGLAGFGVLDFAPVGVPIVLAGIAYMALWGRRLLPQSGMLPDSRTPGRQPLDLVDVYRLGERLFRVRVPAGSSLAAKPLSDSSLRAWGGNVVALERGQRVIPAPQAATLLDEGDVLFLEGRLEEFQERCGAAGLELLSMSEEQTAYLESEAVAIAEAVLAPRSLLLGQTLRVARFREKYGMNVLGVWRAGRPIRSNLGDLPLAYGDALLLQGPRERMPLLRTEPDLILLDSGDDLGRPFPVAAWKRWLAPAIMAVALIMAALNTSLIGEIMLAGTVLMVLSKIIAMDQAYGAIEWRSVFLVAGMLPLGLAMTKSGAAGLLADKLIAVLGPAGPLALLAGLFLLTAVLTQAMNGAAVATVVAPIAIGAGQHAGLDPRALAMGVALASSMAFLTPLGHPVNILVMGPGGYKFKDYLKAGWLLSLLIFAVVMAVLPIFWPLKASYPP